MTKRQAKRWACGMAAALLRSDAVYIDWGDDEGKTKAAYDELVAELARRGDEPQTEALTPSFKLN